MKYTHILEGFGTAGELCLGQLVTSKKEGDLLKPNYKGRKDIITMKTRKLSKPKTI